MMLYVRCAVLLSVLVSSIAFAQSGTIEEQFRNAVTAQERGDFAAAVREYRELLRANPNLVDARANLAASLVHLGQFDEAVAEYRTALKQDPTNKDIRLNLALAFYKKGDLSQAAIELDSLLKTEPGNTRFATLLADCYSRMGDDTKAIALLKPLQADHPEDLDLDYVLGSAFIRSGKTDEGVPLLERVGREGNSADAYLLAGSALFKQDEKSRAVDDLQAAARLNPNLPGLATQLGIAKEGSGDAEGAEQDLRKAVQLNPTDFEATVHLGGVLYSQRKLDEARVYIEKALALKPDSLFALYEMALLESAAGQDEAAVSALERVERGEPDWLDPHVRLAALYYKVKRPADGLRERQIVDKLTAEQQKQGPTPPVR